VNKKPSQKEEEDDIVLEPVLQLARAKVAQEVAEHGKTWCSKECRRFLPSAYREKRLVEGMKRKQAQLSICGTTD